MTTMRSASARASSWPWVTKSVVILEALLQVADLLAQALAQVLVEAGEGLVEEQDLRLEHERAGERDALLLAAGELVRHAARRSR